ncbi:MAG: PqqD family protein [Gammaproteobacteria bacterium]|nr:PqqD family protein [Gammaproteobacteria bacterium]
MPRTDLLVREVDGETVILDRKADLIHTLNPTASFIWNAMQHGTSIQDIVQSMAATFEVDAEKATADVTTVLGNFRDLGLLQVT